jgi:putative ABC transport system permease protein
VNELFLAGTGIGEEDDLEGVVYRGTQRSNLICSSGESANHRFRRRFHGLDVRGSRPRTRVSTGEMGSLHELRIVGVVLSPEYVFATKSGDPLPDDKQFGILWMERKAMAAAFDLDGAFNNVVATLAPGAKEVAVLAGIDRLLEPYGGLVAYGRYHQPSHRYLSDEVTQQGIMATTVPVIFLGVAAFLLNVVLGRHRAAAVATVSEAANILQTEVPDLLATDAVLTDGSSASLTNQARTAGAKILSRRSRNQTGEWAQRPLGRAGNFG